MTGVAAAGGMGEAARVGGGGAVPVGAAGEVGVGAAGLTGVGGAGETGVGWVGVTGVGVAGETGVGVLVSAAAGVTACVGSGVEVGGDTTGGAVASGVRVTGCGGRGCRQPVSTSRTSHPHRSPPRFHHRFLSGSGRPVISPFPPPQAGSPAGDRPWRTAESSPFSFQYAPEIGRLQVKKGRISREKGQLRHSAASPLYISSRQSDDLDHFFPWVDRLSCRWVGFPPGSRKAAIPERATPFLGRRADDNKGPLVLEGARAAIEVDRLHVSRVYFPAGTPHFYRSGAAAHALLLRRRPGYNGSQPTKHGHGVWRNQTDRSA